MYILQGYIGVPLKPPQAQAPAQPHAFYAATGAVVPYKWPCRWEDVPCNFQNHSLGGGFKYVNSFPLLGEMIQFDLICF